MCSSTPPNNITFSVKEYFEIKNFNKKSVKRKTTNLKADSLKIVIPFPIFVSGIGGRRPIFFFLMHATGQ